MKNHAFVSVAISDCLLLERNPQYLTPRQMDALKKSIGRDGFVVPILVRKHTKSRGKYEIISGNHRFMAAQELGMKAIPAVIARMSEKDAKRLALNLNLIHGEPEAEQLAPFLADLEDDVLADIHLEGRLLADVLAFDDILKERLDNLEGVPNVDNDSVTSPIGICKCPKCGKTHIASK
jgi:ParB-like chromosome segregation protein Spo0J